jgi:hypothetical protein
MRLDMELVDPVIREDDIKNKFWFKTVANLDKGFSHPWQRVTSAIRIDEP